MTREQALLTPRTWRLATRLYAALAVLLVVTVAVTVVWWGDGWVQTWMPNFVSEWSGLLLAVAVVDRIVERARRQEDEDRRVPVRRLAGEQFSRALYELVSLAVHSYASESGVESEDDEPAAAFLARWAPMVSGFSRATDAQWLYIFANACEEAADKIRDARALYVHSLDHEEVAALDEVVQQLRMADARLDGYARHVDWTTPNPIPENVRLPPDVIAPSVGEVATIAAAAFAKGDGVVRALTSRELTTRDAWGSWKVINTILRMQRGEQGQAAPDPNR